jgi:EpsD family peptidyl-prolyl cis-trans isomerase
MNLMRNGQAVYEPAGLTARALRWVAAGAAVLALVACGDKKDKPATQTAARVNKEEITVHQINFLLQQQRVNPEQQQAAAKMALERLIDQELAIQKAQELKIDRDPKVVQQIEAARRDIIARNYVEKIANGAAKPTDDEIRKFYSDKPALFKERRVYSLQEVMVEAKPDQLQALRTKLEAAKDIAEFVDYLKANNIRHGGNQAVRTPEQLPEDVVNKLATMKKGESVFTAIPNGARIVVIADVRDQPVDETRAREPIEQILMAERRRRMVEEDVAALRKAAEIKYLGEYASAAGAAASAPGGLTPASGAPAMEPGGTNVDPGGKGTK